MKKVPVVVRKDLSKTEADALRLADNRVASTEYDMGMIQDELRRIEAELEGVNFELSDIGFDIKEIDFSTSDLGEINDEFFREDIAEAVEEQRKENEVSIEETDNSAAPIGDALGFKRVTVMQSREIRGYMAQIEEITGEKGPEALVRFLKDNLGGSAA